MRLPLPEDPMRRGLAVALVCSILLHVLLFASLLWTPKIDPFARQKKGESLFVDLAPDKPEEKAPLGNPSRAPGPPPAPEPAAPAPPPKIAAPPARPAPAPPRQVAKLPAPEPPRKAPALEPPAKTTTPPPAPEPGPAPPPKAAREPESPAPSMPTETARSQAPATAPPAARSEPSDPQTALARPRPSSPVAGIFRSPGGGGGLQGGRGGVAGEPVPLDTPDPDYREYMQKVRQRIYAKWGYPYEAQSRGLQGRLVVEFHIARDGHLQFIELRESSGEDILDSFAMTAVKLAQIYDPLPDAMRREVLPIVATFVYTLRGPLSVLQSVQ